MSLRWLWLQVRGDSTPSGFVIWRWIIEHSENPEGRQFQNRCLCSSCPHAKIFAHPLVLWSHGQLWLWMQETPRAVLCPPLLCGFGEARGAYIIAHKCSTSLWLKVPLCSHQVILLSFSSSPLSLLFHPQIPALLLNAQQFNLALLFFLPYLTVHLFPFGKDQRMKKMLTWSSNIIKCLNQQVFISSKLHLLEEINPMYLVTVGGFAVTWSQMLP